jgi:transcriptional regulator
MLVLTTLSRLGPQHGYAIAKHIEATSGDVLRVEEGSLYPALQRMLVKGWVTADWIWTAGNRRARVYRLTRAGRQQLEVEVSAFGRVMAAIGRVIQPA